MDRVKTWVAAVGFTLAMLVGAVAMSEMMEARNSSTSGPIQIRADTSGDLITSGTFADDAAFTPGTSSVQIMGAEFDDTTPDSVNEGDAGAVRMSANRNQYATLRDAAGNERGVNVTAGNAAEVDIAEQSLTAVKVSDDASANATANRMWVNSNVDQLGGNAIAVNGGAKSTGVQTMTLATDDPAVAALEIIDDWDDGADHAQVDISTQTLTALKVSDDASANAETNPMYQQTVHPIIDDNDTGQCIAIPAAEADYVLPVKDAFEICAHGNEAYVLCAAAAPVAATTAVGGYSLRVGDGQCVGPFEMENAGTCSVIGTVAAGAVCFRGLNYN